ncbi:hypothetical protein CFBP3846_05133 [Pseudomonas syringae pv. avii]|uniref:Uncharacterized protein n=1 Tax=Pseudomonas syringae pv. avii TaxID=663959 RepID=A0ABY1UDG7_PSESX|nr:hypothetical protein [Pseudomonas syringae]KWT02824.1 hypothetical protein AL046_02505 [Pseudomonas syringae pv. avii]POP90549.1 hypothetical protein CXB40_29035 [Pseudomonas syringae pv. avii]SOS29501.1 hypothetical protein CFBP3846_05133 [Pseudomonas syringae pv. avii]
MILYKYYNAENGLKAIESRRLGFRSPEYFNDPFELTALSNGDGPGSKLDMLRQQVQQLKEHVVIPPGVRIVVASPVFPKKVYRGRKETGRAVLFT